MLGLRLLSRRGLSVSTPSRSVFNSAAVFPSQPLHPTVVSKQVPGPASQRLMQELHQVQDARAVTFVSDLEKSIGNYIADADGNAFLDVYGQIASIALGYNHPALLSLASDPRLIRALVNRPALGVMPPMEWAEEVKRAFMRVAPAGMDRVFTAMCGTCANEIAFKTAFMFHQRQQRGSSSFSEADLTSCMKNQAPGSPDLAIVSFTSAFHGRLFGSLSATRSKALHKVDIPAFDWPQAPFPQLKYPLDAFAAENAAEEARCLEALDHILRTNKSPVAACIIEPILSEGGDRHASPAFFRGIREVTRRNNVLMIVDEVQTGVGASGRFWAHEHWQLPESDLPDMVTFSKKFQAAGFYYRSELLPAQSYRNFNTWMGDPVRTLQAATIVDQIMDQDLLGHVQDMGAKLVQVLTQHQEQYPSLIQNARGVGTFAAFDMPTPAVRDDFIARMWLGGVHMGGSGEATVRMRPMLVFGDAELGVFASTLASVLAQMK